METSKEEPGLDTQGDTSGIYDGVINYLAKLLRIPNIRQDDEAETGQSFNEQQDS